MMTICFYTTHCAPLVSIGDFVADYMTGNNLRKILRNHIDNHKVLSVSYFPKWTTRAEAFRREFIEPCLKDGYPQAGLYHTRSKLLNCESVDYLVNVIPYSDKLRDEQINPDYHDGNTPAMYRKFIIDKLKSMEVYPMKKEFLCRSTGKSYAVSKDILCEVLSQECERLVEATKRDMPRLLADQLKRENERLRKAFGK